MEISAPLVDGRGLGVVALVSSNRSFVLYLATLFCLCLRPPEGLTINGRDVLPLVLAAAAAHHGSVVVIVRGVLDEQPDKVGQFDNSLPVDQPHMCFLATELVNQAGKVRAKKPLFDFTLPLAKAMLRRFASDLGISDHLSLHQCRHFGAS